MDASSRPSLHSAPLPFPIAKLRERGVMKFSVTVTILAASPAFGHTGHIAESAGHSHWLAVGAISVALAITAFRWLRPRVRRLRGDRSVDDSPPDGSTT